MNFLCATPAFSLEMKAMSLQTRTIGEITKLPGLPTKSETEPKPELCSKFGSMDISEGYHIIGEGDTLERLSIRYSVPLTWLKSTNKIHSNEYLFVGSAIKVFCVDGPQQPTIPGSITDFATQNGGSGANEDIVDEMLARIDQELQRELSKFRYCAPTGYLYPPKPKRITLLSPIDVKSQDGGSAINNEVTWRAKSRFNDDK